MYLTIRKRTLAFALMALLTLGALPFGYARFVEKSGAIAAASDWGLSFQEAGKTPVGNATAEYLARFDAHYVGDTSRRVLYLTFDAGYENGYTEKILDTLRAHRAPAAFFVVGSYLDACPALVRRMAEDGHVVGNHTETHPDMSKITDSAAFAAELESVEARYRALVGLSMPKFYRPPQGRFSEENLRAAQALGYHTVFWSLAYADWYVDRQPARDDALKLLTGRVHNGAIVLLHSTSKTNCEILDELLTRWEALGYEFRPITDLAGGACNFPKPPVQ